MQIAALATAGRTHEHQTMSHDYHLSDTDI